MAFIKDRMAIFLRKINGFTENVKASNAVEEQLVAFADDYKKVKGLQTRMLETNETNFLDAPQMGEFSSYWFGFGYTTSTSRLYMVFPHNLFLGEGVTTIPDGATFGFNSISGINVKGVSGNISIAASKIQNPTTIELCNNGTCVYLVIEGLSGLTANTALTCEFIGVLEVEGF